VAHLFLVQMQVTERDIQERLKGSEPEVEVLLVEQTGAGRLRLFIDHPKGVDLALCERVTRNLGDLLEDYSLEVSSPGPQRPLVKPEHFRSFVGRRVKVLTREEHEGKRSLTGELVGASDDAVTVAVDDGIVSIPYADINRSNLVEG
jgi:ribosome maturation factor RimP